jgi:hypothetical protein
MPFSPTTDVLSDDTVSVLTLADSSTIGSLELHPLKTRSAITALESKILFICYDLDN